MSELDIRDGRIYYRIYQQDGSMQDMDVADTLDNRRFVEWIKFHDRFTAGEFTSDNLRAITDKEAGQ